MRRRIKSLIGGLVFRSGLYRRLLGDRAVVACFHRVDDGLAGRILTNTSSEFRAFCRFAARYFEVIPLGELVARLREGRPVAGCLVITFDDGYLDNHDVAAPELRRQGLPATFFVSTDLIESETVPFWDEQAGVSAPWMSWDQVRSLRAQGFEIGAHTVSHVDLGKVHGEQARREIQGSRQRLERELGEAVTLFSYPFGRRDQITEENRRIVQDAGFECCASAYGGLVSAAEDPFRLRRVPVTRWHRWPAQWGYELLVSRP